MSNFKYKNGKTEITGDSNDSSLKIMVLRQQIFNFILGLCWILTIAIGIYTRKVILGKSLNESVKTFINDISCLPP